MNENQNGQLGQNLVYEDCIPLRWSIVAEGEIEPHEVLHLDAQNEKILQMLATLDRILTDVPDEEAERNSSDLSRIESKLNLVIELVLELIEQNQKYPLSVPIQMTTQSLSWQDTDPVPGQGDHLLVELFLNQHCPKPVRFLGVVDSVNDGQDSISVVTFRIQHLGAGVLGLLERLIFRQHRRRVAMARRRDE